MWSDKARDRYWWVEARNQIEELLCELSKAEDDEEADLYYLELLLKDEADLEFFLEAERKEIERLLAILIEDTKKHHSLLGEMSEEIKRLGQKNGA